MLRGGKWWGPCVEERGARDPEGAAEEETLSAGGEGEEGGGFGGEEDAGYAACEEAGRSLRGC